MNFSAIWYKKTTYSYFLWPFSWCYRGIISFRRLLFKLGIKKTTHFPVPVIIVGNITVGGTGKTPLVIGLVNWLKEQGWKPGVVSRGYSGKDNAIVQPVEPQSDPRKVGDEPVLIAKKTGCPVFIGRNRVAAVSALLANSDCNIVISDDGLQHLALGRAWEIAVIDGERRFGNGFCLPAGPLREPVTRLCTVNRVVSNGRPESGELSMCLTPGSIYQINHPQTFLKPEMVKGKTVHAMAAIGNPQRFFDCLKELGWEFIPHYFPDHYYFQDHDLDFGIDSLVMMTEKDAVKCRGRVDDRHWCLPISAQVEFSELVPTLKDS